MTNIDQDTGEVLERRDIPAMPPEIAKAIVSVMVAITPLSKDGDNTFHNYKYTTVDQVFEMVGRLMAKNGIFVVSYERSLVIEKQLSTDNRGVTKEGVWLSAVYDLYIYHESGTSYGPIARSTKVPASGAQAYASAMSFAEKYFLRSLFKIPTGEQDADADEKRDLPPSPPPPPPPPAARRPPTDEWPTLPRRPPPAEWEERTRKLFRASKSQEDLDKTFHTVERAYAFTLDQVSELDAMLREESRKFDEQVLPDQPEGA